VRVSLDKEEIVDLNAVKPKLEISNEKDKVLNANEQKALDKEFEGELEDGGSEGRSSRLAWRWPMH
jgi:hypothetical protein